MPQSPQLKARLASASVAWRNGAAVSAAVSVLLILSHAAFLLAQLGGYNSDCGMKKRGDAHITKCPGNGLSLDGMFAAVLHGHIEYDTGGIMSAGLEALTSEMCYAKGRYEGCPMGRETPIMSSCAPPLVPRYALASRATLVPRATPALGVRPVPPRNDGLLVHQQRGCGCGRRSENMTDTICEILECSGGTYNKVAGHFSYLYAVTNLASEPAYDSHGHAFYPGYASAACLVAFSFVWPHVKLLLLHFFFYLPMTPGRRRNGLYWFAFFGKWSLTDVLVMSAVVGLFNLRVDKSLVQVWEQLHVNFLPLCDAMCTAHYTPGANLTAILHGVGPLPVSNCSVACSGIEVALDRVLTSATLPHSEVDIGLKIVGLGSLYAFCLAVILSISVGVWVDKLDEDLREVLIDEALRAVHPIGDAASSSSVRPLSARPATTHGSAVVGSSGTVSLGTRLLDASAADRLPELTGAEESGWEGRAHEPRGMEARRAEGEFDCLPGHLQLVSSRDGSVDVATWKVGTDAPWAQKR
mgnify:CR=1 FL=1